MTTTKRNVCSPKYADVHSQNITAFFIRLLIMIRRVTVLDLRFQIDLRAMPLLLFWVACHFLSYYVLDSAEPSSPIYHPHDSDNGITT